MAHKQFSPPHSTEAEEAVLGALIIDPAMVSRASTLLSAADFYFQKHAHIYEALLALHAQGDPVDFVTLRDQLNTQGKLEQIGGVAYLGQLANVVPSALHIEAYARQVHDMAVRRRILSFASDAARLAYALDQPLDETLDKIETSVLHLRGQIAFQDRVRSLSTIMRDVYDALEAAYHQETPIGIPTGFPDLDRVIGGLRPGNLAIVGARPSLGKSSLLTSFAVSAIRHNVPTVLFSLEMSANQIGHRLLTMETGIDVLRLQAGRLQDDEWPMIADHTGALSDLPLWVDDTPQLSVVDLRAKARRLYAAGCASSAGCTSSGRGLGLILLDYVQLARAGRRYDSRYREIGEITAALKGLAKELNVPVVAASQAGRGVEQRAEHRPTMVDLRESGNQEADADVIILIHHNGDGNGNGNGNSASLQPAEFIVAKNRNGKRGVNVPVLWQPHRARFVTPAKANQRVSE